MHGKMPIPLSQLLSHRPRLLRQARLANSAYAFWGLSRYVERIRRARLSGLVALQSPDPAEERYWATLTALEGSPAVLEEHFTEEDLMDLADMIGHVTGEPKVDLVFPLEEIEHRFVRPLRAELEQAGVVLDVGTESESAAPADDSTISHERG